MKAIEFNIHRNLYERQLYHAKSALLEKLKKENFSADDYVCFGDLISRIIDNSYKLGALDQINHNENNND